MEGLQEKSAAEKKENPHRPIFCAPEPPFHQSGYVDGGSKWFMC